MMIRKILHCYFYLPNKTGVNHNGRFVLLYTSLVKGVTHSLIEHNCNNQGTKNEDFLNFLNFIYNSKSPCYNITA